MHWEEGQVNTNEHQPEVYHTTALVITQTSNQTTPEVYTSKDTEDGTQAQYIMEVSDHVVSQFNPLYSEDRTLSYKPIGNRAQIDLRLRIVSTDPTNN